MRKKFSQNIFLFSKKIVTIKSYLQIPSQEEKADEEKGNKLSFQINEIEFASTEIVFVGPHFGNAPQHPIGKRFFRFE